MSKSTQDLIDEGARLAAKIGEQMAAVGDFVIVCVDAPADQWVIFPIAEITDQGIVRQVIDRDGVAVRWAQIADHEAVIILPARMFNVGAVKALCWQLSDGLAPLREVLKALVKPAGLH